MTTLSLEASKKLFEIVGEYETDVIWIKTKLDDGYDGQFHLAPSMSLAVYKSAESKKKFSAKNRLVWFPAPNFAELIRVLPKIGEKKGWGTSDIHGHASEMTIKYISWFQTEPEGIAKVEAYLMKLL